MHYHFCEKEDVKRGIEKGEFVEYAEVHGNYYGTRSVLCECLYSIFAYVGLLRVMVGNGTASMRTVDEL